MEAQSAPPRTEPRENAFGLMRLLLAAAVILSHTPEIIDGDRRREPLTRVFGTISLGDLAVDGFFLVSGYLIAGSFLNCPKAWPYLRNRIARIYPGFAVASLVSLAIVAPLAGAAGGDLVAMAGRSFARLAALQRPEAPGIFAGTFHRSLNNPMWTIAYEFRCYLLLLLLGLSGALQRPWLILGLAVGMLSAFELVEASSWRRINVALPHSLIWLGFLDQTLRMTGIFLSGSLFFLWRDKLRFTAGALAASALGLVACLSVPVLAELGVAMFGGYLIIGIATSFTSGVASRINNRDDISYGLYLYAWPVTKVILWYHPDVSIAAANGLTLLFAAACGYLSWHLVEKPVLRRVRRSFRPQASAAATPHR